HAGQHDPHDRADPRSDADEPERPRGLADEHALRRQPACQQLPAVEPRGESGPAVLRRRGIVRLLSFWATLLSPWAEFLKDSGLWPTGSTSCLASTPCNSVSIGAALGMRTTMMAARTLTPPYSSGRSSAAMSFRISRLLRSVNTPPSASLRGIPLSPLPCLITDSTCRTRSALYRS